MDAFGAVLLRVVTPRRFPAVHAVITAGAMGDHVAMDHGFAFGPARILDGVGALVEQRRGAAYAASGP
jgi:hypothetical protein